MTIKRSRASEQIQLLAFRADSYAYDIVSRTDLMPGETWTSVRNEKFAELIVKECANRLAQDFIPEEEIIEGYNEDWDSALRSSAQTIKEHFGIKE